jgi:predicted RNA-binding protein YlxR (DUF448 family)
VAPAGELDRYVRLADGLLSEGRTLPGRGAWLCRASAACVDMASRRRAFGRALRAEVRPEAVDRLRESVADRARMVSSKQDETGEEKD